jgi:group I intron endonuclease
MINIESLPKKAGIYKIISPTNKVYIGKTQNIKQRFLKYSRLLCEKQKKLYNSFLKYGFDSHSVEIIEIIEIIEINELINLLSKKEIYYIKKFNSYMGKNGLNLTEGGDGMRKKHSEKTKKKISESLKNSEKFKKTIQSKEYREKLSKSLIGHEGHNKGIPRKLEDIEKIKKGVRKRIKEFGTRKHTTKTKQKMSKNRKGELNGNAKKYKISYKGEIIEFNCRKYIKKFLNDLNDELNLSYKDRYSYDGLFKNGKTKEIFLKNLD